MNVLEHALQLERDAQVYYEKLANETTSPELKTIFTLLAEAERTHYESLAARRGEPAVVRAESKLLDESRNVFQRLLTMKELHGTFIVDPDGYLHAVKAEEESIRYYQKAAELEPNEDAKQLLLALVAEERIHLNIIENIYEFVEAPRSYIECLEFIPREPL